MDDEQPRWNLREGMSVMGADGGKIGQVIGVQATFFVVEKGWLFPTDYYIPAEVIQRVEADAVHLTVSKEDALHQGWDVLPVEEAEALHKDAVAAGTTLGGYTAEMGKMEAEVDVKPADIAEALAHPTPPPVALTDTSTSEGPRSEESEPPEGGQPAAPRGTPESESAAGESTAIPEEPPTEVTVNQANATASTDEDRVHEPIAEATTAEAELPAQPAAEPEIAEPTHATTETEPESATTDLPKRAVLADQAAKDEVAPAAPDGSSKSDVGTK